jgi:hypothetical protein
MIELILLSITILLIIITIFLVPHSKENCNCVANPREPKFKQRKSIKSF